MNREIKFRVWNKERKCFERYVNDAIRFGVESIITIPANSNNFVIQQYTGVKDKNGKEIYEGDIIKTENYNSPYDEIIGVVEYGTDASFYIVDIKKSNICLCFSYCGTIIPLEIIGNIFENPELLISEKTLKTIESSVKNLNDSKLIDLSIRKDN